MKQKFLLLAFSILCISSYSQSKARFGLKAGINSSKITNTSLHSKRGLYAGVLLDVRLADSYAIQPEITYTNQGARSGNVSDNDLRLNYISIAIANKFFVSQDRRFHLILGPSLAVNFDDNFINLMNDGGNSKATPFDFALFGGMGYELGSGLTIEARFKQGLVNVDLFSKDFKSEF